MTIVASRLSKINESQTLAITAKANELKEKGIKVLSLSAGEPDFDTPEHIQQAAIDAIKSGFTHYTTNNGIIELREAICKKFKDENQVVYKPNEILVCNGGKHAIANFFMAFLNPEDEVIIPAPYWVSYPELVKLAEATPVIVQTGWENNFKITPEQLKKSLTNKTKLFVLNSPSNPTGTVYTADEIKTLCQICVDHQVYILSDEIYEHLIFNGEKHLCPASIPELKPYTIVVNGVSKSFAMTGWRIGYLAAEKTIIDGAAKIQSQMTSNASSISQKAALAAISGGVEVLKPMFAEFKKRRDFVFSKMSKMPFINLKEPGGAFYVFPDLSPIIGRSYNGAKIESINQFCEILISDFRLACVPGDAFGTPLSLRISYATSLSVLEDAMNQLQTALSSLK